MTRVGFGGTREGQVVKISGQYVYLESGAIVVISGQPVDVSGAHVFVESGAIVQISGQYVYTSAVVTVDISGQVVFISGQHIYVESGAIVLVSGQFVYTSAEVVVDISGQVVDISGAHVFVESGAIVLVSGQTIITAPWTATDIKTGPMRVVEGDSGGVVLHSGEIKSVKVKSIADNSGYIFIGGSTDRPYSGFGFCLSPGEVETMDIADFEWVYLFAVCSGDIVCFDGINGG